VTILTALRSRARRTFSREVPPHSYALLRIALGTVGLFSTLALTPIGMYWPIDGLAPLPGNGLGIRAWIGAHGLGWFAGAALFAWLCGSFAAMIAGVRSDLAVFAAFVGVVAQTHWNGLPLSSAHQVMTVLLFCLLWVPTGGAWSLDARRPGAPQATPVAAWPLWLMRWQVAVVYLSSGLYKLAYPTWRDGTAVHWALNLNAFHRFPWTLPTPLAPLEAFLTWSTLLFELSFPLLVSVRRMRSPTLVAGVCLHLGLLAMLELGPFSPLMIASYICYLDPERTARLFAPSRPAAVVAAGTQSQ
jgi:hypothetical protein